MTPLGPVQPSAVYATLLSGCQRPEAVIGVEVLGLCYTHMRVRRFIRRLAHLCLLLDIWANYAA